MTPNLTDAGKNLLLRALTGETITFTKIQLGNGPAQDAKAATGLINPLLTVELSKTDIGEEYVTLTAAFTNATVDSGFHVTEAGFYARDPDDDTKEILYALGNEDESTADYVPNNANRILEMEFSALVFVGDAENVAAVINSSLVYASAADLTAHTENQKNPHNVSKEQVGLANVPNVSTNDQTPTYTDTKIFTTLTSGEKLSTAFSKIKLAITKLISHIANKSNPHGVTAAQVEAAAQVHTHNTSDINAGTLPVARGGTGVTSLAALKNLVKDTNIVCGSYTGDGTQTRFIDLGFTPSMVLVLCTHHPFDQQYSGMATPKFNAIISSNYTNYFATYSSRYVTVQVTTGGFNVTYCSDPGYAYTNCNGYEYLYLALR